ncbi:MAG: HAD-IIB family hydrolase [Candidatus Obscuribacterales bacterium]|nr:HAD-IIB family hydrolase [Candidatus Obscuribacterales bacterium]
MSLNKIMHYHVLACDYDGTLAHNGKVSGEHIAALYKLRASGRKLILVTGRQLSDLLQVMPDLNVFDRVVAENGGLLYNPKTHEERLLTAPASTALFSTLKSLRVEPLSAGQTIIATWQPHEATVLKAIRELGLELEIIFNKGAVMVLPSGINKATGLQAALTDLELSEHNAIAIGDAENDHAMFSLCELSVAVNNAIPSVKQHADFIVSGHHGHGVSELVEMIINNDCASISKQSRKHQIVLGLDDNELPVNLDNCSSTVLICGPSGSGKTSAAIAIVEQLVESKYQFCLIDPERDFDHFEGAVVLGNSVRPPSVEEVVQLIQSPDQNVIVSLLGLAMTDRPAFFAALLPHLQELKARTGRPHWTVVDEAHYLLPSAWNQAYDRSQMLDGMLLITVHPDHVAKPVLKMVDTFVIVGSDKSETISAFCSAVEESEPLLEERKDSARQNVVWFRSKDTVPVYVRPWRSKREHHRHQRKYAEGNLGAYHSFYFRGASGRLNLCANNLLMFLHLANGIDDDTWLYHLRRHDYSRWFRYSIKDARLSAEVEPVENDFNLSPGASRDRIKHMIEARYSPPV